MPAVIVPGSDDGRMTTMTRSPQISSLAPLVLLGVSCFGRETQTSWVGTVTVSAGVTVVSNTAQGVWGEAEGWSVVQDLVIGQAEGRAEYLFGRIGGIGVASDGRIVVLDQQASQLRVFDAEGVYLNAFGASGSGPGELGEAAGPCLIGAGDTLFVPDPMNLRVNRYTLDGSGAGSFPRDVRSGIDIRWDVSDDGSLAVQLRPLALSEEVQDSLDAVVILASDGSHRDTLLAFPSGKTVELTGVDVAVGWFRPEPLWALAPDGRFVYGVNEEYRVEIYGSGGELEQVVTKSYQPRPVVRSDQDFIRDAVGGFLAHRVPRFQFEQVVNGARFAEFYPAYFRLWSGPQNSLWVQHVLTPSDMSLEERDRFSFGTQHPQMFAVNPQLALGAPDWDVFDAEGRFLGVVTLPGRFDPVKFVGNAIYGVWRDELDVEYVMKLTVLGSRAPS